MKLNKKIGQWVTKKDKWYKTNKPTLLDQYAYQLYLDDVNPLIGNSYKIEQIGVIVGYKLFGNFKKYYILANVILLREKIEKIKRLI